MAQNSVTHSETAMALLRANLGFFSTEIPEDLDPLGDVDLGDHSCCILHFLIMLVAMILLGFYTNDRKKRQAKIHELRRALKAEEAAKEQV